MHPGWVISHELPESEYSRWFHLHIFQNDFMSHVLPVTSSDAVGTDGAEHVGNRFSNFKYKRLLTFTHTYSGFKNVFVVST